MCVRARYIKIEHTHKMKLLFFVNKRSGGRHSRELNELLSERRLKQKDSEMIFLDDYETCDEVVLVEKIRFEVFESTEDLSAGSKDGRPRDQTRAIACGGDGTVSWVFSLLRKALEGSNVVVPLAHLPLGTGNEFARVFGWKEAAQRWEHEFDSFCEEVKNGNVASLDMWKFTSEVVIDSSTEGGDRGRGDDIKIGWKDGLRKRFNNLSVGVGNKNVVNPAVNFRPTHLNEENEGEKEEEEEGKDDDDENEYENEDEENIINNTERFRRSNWSFSGHLRSPSELEESLFESIRNNEDASPHPILPHSLFADPPLSPPGSTNATRQQGFVPPPIVMTTPTNPFVDLTTTTTSTMETKTTNTLTALTSTQDLNSDLNSDVSSDYTTYTAATNMHSRESSFYDGGKDISLQGSIIDGKHFNTMTVKDVESSNKQGVEIETCEKLASCFFSVGFDAGIALQFHQFREKTEKCCVVPKTIGANVAGYSVLGAIEWLAKRKYLSKRTIILYVDGKRIALPERANSIQIFNIHSSTTGVDFFGTGEKSKSNELADFSPPSVSDGLVEIVATYGVGHLSAIRFKMTHSHRLAQGRKVEIILKRALPVQIDGEPWLQKPGRLKFEFCGTAPVVLGLGDLRNVYPSPSSSSLAKASLEDLV